MRRIMAEQAAMEDDDGDFMELDDAFYLNTCSFPGRQEPRYSPSALLTTSAHFSRMTASSGGAAERMEGEPVESDTAFLEPQRMSLAEDLFSEGTGSECMHPGRSMQLRLEIVQERVQLMCRIVTDHFTFCEAHTPHFL